MDLSAVIFVVWKGVKIWYIIYTGTNELAALAHIVIAAAIACSHYLMVRIRTF